MNKPLNFSTEAQNQLIEISNRFHNSDNQAEATTTSLKVAKYFQRNHRDVLRALRELECSAEFSVRNFALTEYIDTQGKPRPMYEMTKNGFVFLVMGFTGKQAALFKESYIAAFDEMSDFIKSQNRIGRSWGCPAVPRAFAEPIINTIKGENCLFIYYPDQQYLSDSKWLKSEE